MASSGKIDQGEITIKTKRLAIKINAGTNFWTLFHLILENFLTAIDV